MDEADTGPKRLRIAPWDSRFWAWLIDVIVVGAVVSAFWGTLGAVVFWSSGPFDVGGVGELGSVNGLAFWAYWTLLEGYRGQSIGKLVMNLEVTDREGNPVDYGAAAIESFGKAFLLPIDLLVGVLAYEGKKLRLFNRLSETIVVRSDPDPLDAPEGVEYVMPGEE